MKKKTRADVILVSVLLAVSLIALGLFFLMGEEGSYVVVTVGGEEYCRLPLSQNAEIRIPSHEGGYNLLIIEDGRAYVREASCPDGICAAHRPISRTGESILCKPNQVAIWVEGGAESDGLDVIS
ncbi:MAG: NusG domain II-containing protein [Clostridia bacterium]|nr:NusG domain II-containing protein [Clostridia bacterium]